MAEAKRLLTDGALAKLDFLQCGRHIIDLKSDAEHSAAVAHVGEEANSSLGDTQFGVCG